ncbi:hypothetical protein D4764_01G0000460 [Takifugu flavidus]|uniref:Uncharacterized protein n=1 Tax=Takifugu flavidus TaxID=433684 RepID=A0A5C6PMZ4_9TELE|nr:hypothetical protein D4764_01G0000460 [Takifugu flavidus]
MFNLHCQRSETFNIYGLMALVNLVIVPVMFILFSYARILLISYQSSKEASSLNGLGLVDKMLARTPHLGLMVQGRILLHPPLSQMHTH